MLLAVLCCGLGACSGEPSGGPSGGADAQDGGPLFHPDANPDTAGSADAQGPADAQDAVADTASDATGTDAPPSQKEPWVCGGSGQPGCACTGPTDCASGHCIATPDQGSICTATCSGDCPSGYVCAPAGGTDVVYLCLPRWPVLCNPCDVDGDCQAPGVGKALCVDRGAMGHFCGAACQGDGDCPGGYTCQSVTSSEGKTGSQCMPAPGKDGSGADLPTECSCSNAAVTAQLGTSCGAQTSGSGTCTGVRQCGKDGLSACSALPSPEQCNGLDDDCDGAVDDLACDDGNPCTLDACDIAKGCTATEDDGIGCDDGDGCSVGDTCKAGQCVPGKPKLCAGGQPCQISACDADSGQCKKTAQADGTGCDDGSACTQADACATGACSGKGVDCNDGSVCTLDTCDPLKGCQHAASAAPCDDGNACTQGDVCSAGQCAGTAKPASACDDGNVCSTDGCDPAKGCVATANTAPCQDGNPCTAGDVCKNLQCQPGTSTCQCQQDADCKDDGDLCNGTLYCDKTTASWSCKVNPATIVTCSKTGDTACAQAACQSATGKCALVPVADGKACDADGSVCTLGDACAGGKCAAGAKIVCNDGNPCTDDACDAKAGCVQAANAAPCDADGNPCTVGDACKAKVCVPGGPKACDDGLPCTTDGCSKATGACVGDPAPWQGQPCDADGSVCTVGDACDQGACKPGSAKTCDDGNPCTQDGCDAKLGCQTSVAADKTACGSGMWCQAGKCVAEGPSLPLPGELLITEIMVDPSTSESNEWAEIHNPTSKPLLLEGLWFGDLSFAYKLTKAGGLVIQPGEYLVLAAKGTVLQAAKVPVAFYYPYLSTEVAYSNNGDDGVCLTYKDTDACSPSKALALVVYQNGTSGWPAVTSGASFQLDPTKTDAASMTSGASWCKGKTTIGTSQDKGTPGLVNTPCP